MYSTFQSWTREGSKDTTGKEDGLLINENRIRLFGYADD